MNGPAIHRDALRFILIAAVLSLAGCDDDSQSSVDDDLSDTSVQVGWYGLDYEKLKTEALTDDRALRGFFLVASLTDAHGSEGYSGDITEMLKNVGEERFERVLANMGSRGSSAIHMLRFGMGIDQDIPGLAEKFARQYPKVWKLMESDWKR